MKHPLALLVLPALSLGGCYVESDTVYVEADPGSPDPYYGASGGVPAAATAGIDADAAMETNPGLESGVYVEYLSGGLWTVYTTCGEVSQYGECEWDIATSVDDGDFIGAEGYDLDPGETFETDDIGAWTIVYTGNDYDGLYLQTTPGATLHLDVLLDGSPAERYIFWIEDGEVQLGAPTNPIELTPDLP